MDEPDQSWRWVSPPALGSDGLRWHLRAYNHDRARFDDLLFPRILRIDSERPSGTVPPDEDWDRLVPVRAALLLLFLRRLGTDQPGALVELVEPGRPDWLAMGTAGGLGWGVPTARTAALRRLAMVA